MGYSEGYRGFQLGFSPRIAARALWLSRNPSLLRGLLAPAFCMGFFGATKRRTLTSWCVLAGIVGIVSLVRLLPQPWRGIVDFGVVVGLTWGLLAMLVFAWQAVSRRDRFAVDPELPADLGGPR